MASYLLRRLLLAIPTIWVAVTLVFVIFRLVPGDPARLMAGETASEAVVAQIRHELGLDKSLPRQYLTYLGDMARGDVGTSRVYQRGALDQIWDRLPATLLLGAAAMAIALTVGLADRKSVV